MRAFNGRQLDFIAFPMGGIGAGMLCLQGTGALGNVSVRNKPDYLNDPMMFSAVTVKGEHPVSRVVEAPVPSAYVFGRLKDSGNGLPGKNYGLPRYTHGTFSMRFPFAQVTLEDDDMPLDARVVGWSPFIPRDEDHSSLPFAALEYTFLNRSEASVEAVYYFNASNFMKMNDQAHICRIQNGFVLDQPADPSAPQVCGAFCAVVDQSAAVDTAWLRARNGWSFDVLTILWKHITNGACADRSYAADDREPSPGATIAVPFSLVPGEKKTITLRLCWYVPGSDIRAGKEEDTLCGCGCGCEAERSYRPWYGGRFASIKEVADEWRVLYDPLRRETERFTECFYDSTLPETLLEAVAANLCILKSPTVLRQRDGRLWGWEGCFDGSGCCHGSCTHVWNYAQAICHLFPRLERSLRDTEFNAMQSDEGHQTFRAALPICKTADHSFHAASDGQLGGIIKLYRDYYISGDMDWLRRLWPKAKQSLDYCIKLWDPRHEGVLKEPHHNTYDIEFWGADGMCTGFYLGALRAACEIAKILGEECDQYNALCKKGRAYLENRLFDGEYFQQDVEWETLNAKIDLEAYPREVRELILAEGPRYQYGTGCLSDGVVGIWLSEICGLNDIVDEEKLRTNLQSIYRYNFMRDFSKHANPQRPNYALNHDAGLVLCSWPHGGKPSLPFVYSDEVWTGIEYQVASHMLKKGMAKEALDIVNACRSRYDGTVRNPYNEYECGHWYARAMASYALLEGYTGVRYDKTDGTLYASIRNADTYRTFLATADGYGTVNVRDGAVTFEAVSGYLDIKRIEISQ